MRRLYLVLPVYTEVYGGSLHWAWIGQFGVFQWLDESLFWLQLPCLDVAGVSFTKREPVEGIDFLSALVEAARVLEGFNLNGCDIRTSQFGSGDMKTRPAAECVFWSKLSCCSHVYLCILHCTLHTHTHTHGYTHKYTVKGDGVLFAPFYRKWQPLSISVRLQHGIMGIYPAWKAAVIIQKSDASAQVCLCIRLYFMHEYFMWVYSELVLQLYSDIYISVLFL